MSLCQTVLVTDASHEVFQASNPGTGLVSVSGDQVKRLHVVAMVNTEAAVGVEATVCVALEDLRLLALTHLVDGVDGYWDRINVEMNQNVLQQSIK